MAVEQLAVVEGPLSGLGEESLNIPGLTDTAAWMRRNGFDPTSIAIGALAGVAMTGFNPSGSMSTGAMKGAAFGAIISWWLSHSGL